MPFVPGDPNSNFSARREIRLLVVDDQQEHFEQLREMADMYNPDFSVECRLVSDPEEVLEVTANWHPSVVLLDLHIIASAFSLIKQIAEIGPSVVATSSNRVPDIGEKVAQYGGVGYLTKSENPDDMESLLHYIASISAPAATEH
jgi:DNA-binding NarL/FixJ family response regulator